MHSLSAPFSRFDPPSLLQRNLNLFAVIYIFVLFIGVYFSNLFLTVFPCTTLHFCFWSTVPNLILILFFCLQSYDMRGFIVITFLNYIKLNLISFLCHSGSINDVLPV